jgi:hypothetical protein
MQFLDTADRLRILVHRLLHYTTHRLQPLDIGVFGALSTAYSKQLNALQHKSLGLVSMSKRLFYPLFRDAFEEAFEKSRIEHAFEKAGIWPFNPSAVIDILKKPSPEESSQLEKPKTPMTSRAIRRIHREYKANHSVSKLKLILHGHEKLAAQHSIDEHIINGLQEAFKIEKKKRARGKRLNLIGQEDDNGPQFFSPSAIQAARRFQEDKENEEALQKQVKADEKARKALEKEQDERDKKERALERARKRAEAKSEKERKATERKEAALIRKAEKEACKADALATKSTKLASKAIKTSRKASLGKRRLVESTIEVGSSPVAKRARFETSRGRAVITPTKLLS